MGIVNGTTRELVYKEHVSDLAAHQISTAVAVALFALYFAILESTWPIPTTRTALQIGSTWLLLTVLFEFGFGHFVDGKSWSNLAHDYNLADGRVWSLVLLWLGVGPLAISRLRLLSRRSSDDSLNGDHQQEEGS